MWARVAGFVGVEVVGMSLGDCLPMVYVDVFRLWELV